MKNRNVILAIEMLTDVPISTMRNKKNICLQFYDEKQGTWNDVAIDQIQVNIIKKKGRKSSHG